MLACCSRRQVADFGLSNIVSDNSYFNKHAEGTITHLA